MPALLASLSYRSVLRHWIICLLAALVPFQATAALAITTLGPSHVHRMLADSPLATPLQLSDFRRAAASSAPGPTHFESAFGHFHVTHPPLRHRHVRGDASVLVVPDGPLQGDADDPSISPSLAVFVAMLPSTAPWLASLVTAGVQARAFWSPRTHDPEPLERPPRLA